VETLSKIVKEIGDTVAKVNIVVETGDPADEILITAKKNDSDIIVVGYKGYGKEGRFLLGSVTDKVVRHAGKSVLVVR
jgi:nucleotide-binding universal stress UspA family protein